MTRHSSRAFATFSDGAQTNQMICRIENDMIFRKCSGLKQVGGQFARKIERARRAGEDGTYRT